MTRVFGDLEMKYLKEVLDSGKLGWYHEEGSMTTRLEQAFATKIGARFGIARNSAMTAIAQAVSISGAGTGTEVICDPIMHFGALAALYFNAVPRFADVRYDTYQMDPESVRANITDRTKALIVTNLWGMCAELDELRKICDEYGIFMIEDCAHTIGSFWKGKHAGTYGDLSCFSFQQAKHLPTGDGGMMTTDREDLYQKLYNEWAFSGWAPTFMTLNFRMTEAIAAIGLAQMERVDDYVAEYTNSLHMLDDAIRDCAWLRNRHVPDEAVQCGYIWVCTWEGDKHGLSRERFKQVLKELGSPVEVGWVTEAPAYTFDIFSKSTAYHEPDCPVRCPYYKGDYRYHEGLCRVAEDLMPRLLSRGLVEAPLEEVKAEADRLRQAIQITERG